MLNTARQKPATTKATCPHCRGKGFVRQKRKKQTCYHCRGTGEASRGYETKG